jgi:hypothetical protein
MYMYILYIDLIITFSPPQNSLNLKHPATKTPTTFTQIPKPCVTLRPVRFAVKMSSSTRVLQCNPASVSFRLPNEQPHVVCQKTMQALQEASDHLLHKRDPGELTPGEVEIASHSETFRIEYRDQALF